MHSNITNSQSRLFEVIDVLIDSDKCVWEFLTNNDAFRRRIARNFESIEGLPKTRSVFHLYGMQGLIEYPATIIPNPYLDQCLYVDGDFRVVFDNDYAEHLSNHYNVGISCIRKESINLFQKEKEMEALECYVRNTEFDLAVDYENIRVFQHLRYYYTKHFGSFNYFLNRFGLERKLHPRMSMAGARASIIHGMEFERIAKKCFEAIYPEASYNKTFKDCRPDFMVGSSHWVDAKLSKSTVFSSDTIGKYTKHADHLTIIYAIEDVKDEEIPTIPEGVELIHVLEFFEDLPENLKRELTDFIADVRRKRSELNLRGGDNL